MPLTKNAVDRPAIQTIELTSKRFKLASVISGAFFIFGLLFLASGSPGFVAFFWTISILALIYARVGAWWYNR